MASRIVGAVDDSAPLSKSNDDSEPVAAAATTVAENTLAASNSKVQQSADKVVPSSQKTKALKVNVPDISEVMHRQRMSGGKRKANSSDNIENEPVGDCPFFFEDEVFKIDRKGYVKFGVVTDTPDAYSDDDEEEYEDKLGRNEVRVAYYPDGKEIVQQQKNIGLADRTLLPGDVVRRLAPNRRESIGQCGYVRTINMNVDVKVLGSKYVIKNIPCERLKLISLWSRDTTVCLDSWVGNTTNVEERATLRALHGARVEITSNDFYKFKDLQTQCVRDVFNPPVFYPGNTVVGRLPAMERFKNLTPDITLPINKKGRSIFSRYTVESVETDSVCVQWQCKALSKETNNDTESIQHPDECVKGDQLKNLKRLSLFESCMLQIHDRSYLKYSKCDKLIKFSDWNEEQSLKFDEMFKEQHKYTSQPVNDGTRQRDPQQAAPSSTTKAKIKKACNKHISVRNSMTQTTSNEQSKKLTKIAEQTCDAELSEEETTDTEEEFEETEEVALQENESNEKQEIELTDGTSTPTPTTTPTPTPRINTRHAKRRHVKKKMRNLKKSLTAPFIKKDTVPKDGDELVVETLLVYSTAVVVWQDGSIEENIPSTELYPIHHLDNHEFFPGDFVCSNRDDLQPYHRDYGVIQQVDYEGRTAHVKWFQTYVNMDKPIPPYIGQSEVSVYDLKDHPDFQYRPGTMVIRVANFTGEDVNSTAGQIIDNYPDGRIKVWWVNGHITSCYPQDLFEVTQYDADNDYESDESEDSWETESEKSGFGSDDGSEESLVDEQVLTGIDNARKAIKRLENMFHLTQSQPKLKVMQDLLAIYKNCRYLDHLLHTSFFDEDYFHGLVRRKQDDVEFESQSNLVTINLFGNGNKKPKEFSPKVLFNIGTKTTLNSKSPVSEVSLYVDTAFEPSTTTNAVKRKSSTDETGHENQRRKNNDSSVATVNIAYDSTETANNDKIEPAAAQTAPANDEKNAEQDLIIKYKNEYFEIVNTENASISKAFLKTNNKNKNSKNDSGNYTRTENGDDSTFSDKPELIDVSIDAAEMMEAHNSISKGSIELGEIYTPDLCEVFCFLLNEQMDKCRKLIEETYCKAKKKRGKNGDAGEDNADKSDVSSACSTVELEVEEEDTAVNAEETQNAESEVLMQTTKQEAPMASSSPTQEKNTAGSSAINDKPINENCFELISKAPASHRYFTTVIHPANRSQYTRAVHREFGMLQSSLPLGVSVCAFEDRMDLIAAMMKGPVNTPYEDALFFFDMQMPRDYPKSPPLCQYISFCTDRLNPNLYEEGKVCVSLLGTWSGRDTEVWGPDSTLLQVLVSIQGLILVDEPYYNEAGYDKQRGTPRGMENSRMYNEMAIIKVVQSTIKQIHAPPLIFIKDTFKHFQEYGQKMHDRIRKWVEISEELRKLKITDTKNLPDDNKYKSMVPPFPLLPCSRGCCLALTSNLDILKSKLEDLKNMQNLADD